MNALEWTALSSDDASGLVTERARVLGGWLVRTYAPEMFSRAGAVGLTFVPDTHAAWDLGQD